MCLVALPPGIAPSSDRAETFLPLYLAGEMARVAKGKGRKGAAEKEVYGRPQWTVAGRSGGRSHNPSYLDS